MTDSRPTDHSSIATEAADWYARLRAQNVTDLDAVRFRAWIAGDPERRREFEAIDELWDELGAIESCSEVLRERATIVRRRARSPKPVVAQATLARESGRKRLWAIAAIVPLVLGVTLWIHQETSDRYVTSIGEQRTVPLADGSVVTLNTATEIRLNFSRGRRGVELISGQANFEVAKDAARPFVVTAGGSEVHAVGTQFDVYKTADKVTVTLIEGKVAIKEAPVAGGASSPEINLAAGEQLSFETRTGAVRKASADITRVSAWRTRKLDFGDTPLGDAITEANRYSRVQIVLHAPELEKARISGTFEAGRNDLFVEGLQSYFQLNVERPTDRRIILTARH